MIDKEAFLKGLLPEQDVKLSGATVRVRALSRQEVLDLQVHAADLGRLEQGICEAGFVDPPMSAEDVAAWFASAPAGDADEVVRAISILSGMNKEHPKSGLSGVRGEPGP